MDAHDMDHYYTFGEVYETMDACDQLDRMLGRLRRQDLISGEAAAECRRNLATIRGHVESHIASANLVPKGGHLSA